MLNPLASHEADGLNCRLFEAAGCGAVVLTEWRDRLPELFRVPAEVRAFGTFEDLKKELRELLRFSDDERRAVGDAAAGRAHAEHTYAHRFQRIVSILGAG